MLDGQLTLFHTNFTGNYQIRRGTRSSTAQPFSTSDFTELNTAGADRAPSATALGDIIMFDRGFDLSRDLYEAYDAGAVFEVVEHPELNTAVDDADPWISPDGRIVVFSSKRDGGDDDLYMAVR